MAQIVILDVDGTLVDNIYQHSLAWYRAFRRYDIVVPVVRIHRHLGMGGDQIVTALVGEEVEEAVGAELREAWVDEFDLMIDEVRPLPGASDLIKALKDRGREVVLASSAQPQHTDRFLDLLGVREVVDGWTTSEDVERTKPEPDLIEVALERVGGEAGDAVMVGDTTWDIEAASKLGIPVVAVRTGGFGDDELLGAGASAVYDTPAAVLAELDDGPLAVGRRN
jgi:HAD superfamily hydrolase (TIGR01509 family)